MSVDLRGFTAFITGGSSGLGFEMAKALLTHGASVVIAARGGAKLDNAYKKLLEYGDAYAVPMDVRDEESVIAAADWFRAHFDHIDLLVNNAGIGGNAPGMETLGRDYQFFELPTYTFRAVVETNFIGYFLVAKAFVPMMAAAGRGKVVNVSTSDRTMVRPGQIPYGPSRAGAEAMSKIMSQELAGLGISVNVICPGGITDTGMMSDGFRKFAKDNGIFVLPPDVMNRAILFLASEQSTGINGVKIIGKEFDGWLAENGIVFEE